MKTTILNTSILTDFGKFDYTEITAEEAKNLIASGFESAVGHQSTCDVLNTILDSDVKMNRVQYTQKVGDIALIFKLHGRPEEGKILTSEEILEIGYSFGRLTKIS